MLNCKHLSTTNSRQYHNRPCRKSLKMTAKCKEEILLNYSKEMLNHPLTHSQGSENQFSRTTNNCDSRSSINNSNNNEHSSNSNSNYQQSTTCLSSLVTLKTKNKQQQQEQHHSHCHHQQQFHHHHQHHRHPQHRQQQRHHDTRVCQRRRQLQRHCPQQWWLLFASIFIAAVFLEYSLPLAKADQNIAAAAAATDGSDSDNHKLRMTTNTTTTTPATEDVYKRATISLPNISSYSSSSSSSYPEFAMNESDASSDWLRNNSSKYPKKKFKTKFNADDSIFLRFAKRFTDDNNLVSGIIQDCYHKPTFSCFQKNVYVYLNEVLDAQDVNVTQRLKFYRNDNPYDEQAETEETDVEPELTPTQATLAKDTSGEQENEIPLEGRSFDGSAPAPPETPIEEVTNALYGKSIKFAMTHDIELKLPEMMFDGATFRISPKSIEGNGVIAKLELIPKQHNEARLAGKFLMKKIQKIMKSKLLLSFIALVLIIKIIKIKLFWLLPLVIGVGAAKKLLLKFLLFLFPALSHLFKLCSYYQQTYHSTKYHHHHHHINHHHTIIPPWHSSESSHGPWQSAETAHIPELIYSHPPKGHVSAYLHGAPVHESYGPSHEHFEGAWENSGPGLGSEYISDINRVAQIDDKTNHFKPHSQDDANELHTWGLGTTPISTQNKRPLAQHQRHPATLQKPPINQTPQNYQKPQATSHNFNPFVPQNDKQSFYGNKFRNNLPSQSAPSPVYTPLRQPSLPPLQKQIKPQIQGTLSAAAQIAAQYDPTRNQQPTQPQQLLQDIGQQQPQLTPEMTAQLKEALRIQAEQRIVQQQQQILDKQPFVQDGQPLMPLNYDPFYSPILLKIDKIIEQLGINDELCKERVVCSMYKDPERYSPHSNFVSAELSRDTNELQPITSTNPAVVRFFRLIQAARDGQDHKNCLTLYPDCSINTE